MASNPQAVQVLEVPKESKLEDFLEACDYVNMMPGLIQQNGQWVARVEYTILKPHPCAFFSLSKADYMNSSIRKPAWRAAFKRLVQDQERKDKMRAEIQQKFSNKKSLEDQQQELLDSVLSGKE